MRAAGQLHEEGGKMPSRWEAFLTAGGFELLRLRLRTSAAGIDSRTVPTRCSTWAEARRTFARAAYNVLRLLQLGSVSIYVGHRHIVHAAHSDTVGAGGVVAELSLIDPRIVGVRRVREH